MINLISFSPKKLLKVNNNKFKSVEIFKRWQPGFEPEAGGVVAVNEEWQQMVPSSLASRRSGQSSFSLETEKVGVVFLELGALL